MEIVMSRLDFVRICPASPFRLGQKALLSAQRLSVRLLATALLLPGTRRAADDPLHQKSFWQGVVCFPRLAWRLDESSQCKCCYCCCFCSSLLVLLSTFHYCYIFVIFSCWLLVFRLHHRPSLSRERRNRIVALASSFPPPPNKLKNYLYHSPWPTMSEGWDSRFVSFWLGGSACNDWAVDED
jgi:hypothetical protein